MPKKKKGNYHIGTSGWFYEHWDKIFYKDVKPENRLTFYSEHFATVEINNSFYHIPPWQTIEHWLEKTPDHFIFSVKANRHITHVKRLKDFDDKTQFFFNQLEAFKSKLGPILLQLPPSFKINIDRLKDFLERLNPNYDYTFEFRHPSWFVEDTYALLRSHDVALCITDLNGTLSPEVVTSEFTYIRLHGPKVAYQGTYGLKGLQVWQEKIINWLKQGLTVYCYFDNDEKSYATKDASTLINLLQS